MDSEGHRKLEMFFFPYIAGGHLIPMIDVARLFAAHGVKATIVTTPHNALLFQKTIDRDQQFGRDISFYTIKLPTAEVGLPDGCENLLSITSTDMSAKLFKATMKLQEPLERLLDDRRPDCLVSDLFYPWSVDVAARFGIPRVMFQVSGLLPLCAEESLRRHAPHEKVASDSEPFALPGLPDHIELTRALIPYWFKGPSQWGQFLDMVLEAEVKSFGILFNSFYDLESGYAEYFKNEMKRKIWLVGPLCLFNRNVADKADRGYKASIDEESCLSWLNTKKPNSVLYVSFGSQPRVAPAQLLEIAYGLEASGHPFIWVPGKILKSADGEEEGGGGGEGCWAPEGFEERMAKSGRGLIIKGWAPQLLILEHEAIGGFVTHCGWNSTVEGVCAGVPMLTWPNATEQFYIERLVTDVLKIGFRVGVEEWMSWHAEPKVSVSREKVEKVVVRLMGSGDNEVVEMRRRAKEYAEKAKRAVEEEDGSSYKDAIALIKELESRRKIAVGNRL